MIDVVKMWDENPKCIKHVCPDSSHGCAGNDRGCFTDFLREKVTPIISDLQKQVEASKPLSYDEAKQELESLSFTGCPCDEHIKHCLNRLGYKQEGK